VHCPLEQTFHVGSGTTSALKFTSVLPELTPLDMPVDPVGAVLQLVLSGDCVESEGYTTSYGRYTVRCPVQATANIGSQHWDSLKFSNPQNPDVDFIASVLYWAHEGENFYFWPEDATVEEINGMFPLGSEMSPGYFHSTPDGKEIDLNGVHHWAWNGNRILFYPDGYTVDTCAQAAVDISEKLPAGYRISVSNRLAMPVPAGQTFDITGVMHWAWNGNGIYFYPDGGGTTTRQWKAVAKRPATFLACSQ
jgi:hypothetical protein